jgi:hypothetical protein
MQSTRITPADSRLSDTVKIKNIAIQKEIHPDHIQMKAVKSIMKMVIMAKVAMGKGNTN